MLITDQWSWDHPTFEAHVEGMCEQVRAFPHERVAFWGHSTPEAILALFAAWKVEKIACPLNTRLPSAAPALAQLETELFIPQMPKPRHPSPLKWNLNRLGTLLFTSGSSGNPKIAALSRGNLAFNALGSNKLIPLQTGDRWALTLPLFHVGGLGILMRSYLAKSSVLLGTDWKTATHLSLVPTQLYRILKDPVSLPCLKAILLGGAPLPDIKTPWHVVPTYGMTEMGSQIVTGGCMHPFAEMKIANDHEIWVRGPLLFQGYYEKGETSLPLNAEGWFQTKDLGQWDREFFQILGRKDNLFISGGENIQPEEIEKAIRQACGLHEAIVVPIPDAEFGHRPAVFLYNPEKLQLVQAALKDHLPKYKIPIRAFLLPEASGLKPNRKALQALLNDRMHQ
jgi:o-succinylbenzoate---CoA ligase